MADPRTERQRYIRASYEANPDIDLSGLVRSLRTLGMEADADALRADLDAVGLRVLERPDGRLGLVDVGEPVEPVEVPVGAAAGPPARPWWHRAVPVAVVVALAAAVVAVVTRGGSSGRGGPQTRPNVVLVVTDDQTAEMMLALPKTRELLGGHGTTFTNASASYPLCCPSRATLLTGQYAHNHKVLDNVAPLGGYSKLDWDKTGPLTLHEAGYYTSHLGRTLNDYVAGAQPVVPPGWDDWLAPVEDPTFSFVSEGTTVVDNGKVVTEPSDVHIDDVLADRAVATVKKLAPSSTPFYMEVGTVAPHTSRPGPGQDPSEPIAPLRDRGRYLATPLPDTAARRVTDVSGRPAWVKTHQGQFGPETSVKYWREALRSLVVVDGMVEDIVHALDDAGELDDTVIMFTSDNGFLLGEFGVSHVKVTPYEPSVRLPLIVRGPGFATGRSDLPVSLIDVAPTALAAAGVAIPSWMDGVPLQSQLRHARRDRYRALLVEGPPVKSTTPPFWTVRADGFTLIQYADGVQELYDLDRDPEQLHDLIDEPRYAPTITELEKLHDQLKACKGTSCHVMSPPLR